MILEVQGDSEQLRRLKMVLDDRFSCLKYGTGGFQVLVVFTDHHIGERVRLFVEAYCLGAGLTTMVPTFADKRGRFNES